MLSLIHISIASSSDFFIAILFGTNSPKTNVKYDKINVINITAMVSKVEPVSYTHLDVYKRQHRHTDSLTGIYNRYGFDELAEKMINKNPKAKFVAVLLDIDDFKFINDIYGHVYGDKALRSLADSMKAFFPSDALLGRNGGDEFCILLKNYSYEDVKAVSYTHLE